MHDCIGWHGLGCITWVCCIWSNKHQPDLAGDCIVVIAECASYRFCGLVVKYGGGTCGQNMYCSF